MSQPSSDRGNCLFGLNILSLLLVNSVILDIVYFDQGDTDQSLNLLKQSVAMTCEMPFGIQKSLVNFRALMRYT